MDPAEALGLAGIYGQADMRGRPIPEGVLVWTCTDMVGACEEYRARCRTLIRWTNRLSEWWGVHPEWNSYCADIVIQRHDLWVWFVGLDVILLEAQGNGLPGTAQFAAALDDCLEALEAVDEVVQAKTTIDMLRTASWVNLLHNLRAGLHDPYNLTLPWWLDGTLEPTK